MRLKISAIIVIFFIVKIINELVYNKVVQRELVITALLWSAGIMMGMFIFGLIVEKMLSNNLRVLAYAWILLVSIVILGTIIYSPLVLSFFICGVMFYAFLGAEAQLMRSIEENFRFSRFFLILISFIVLIIAFNFSKLINLDGLYVGAVFFIESIFALMISYTIKKQGAVVIPLSDPPAALGLFFIVLSLVAFYFGGDIIMKDPVISNETVLFLVSLVIAFYFTGAIIVYLALENKIIKLKKIRDVNSGGLNGERG